MVDMIGGVDSADLAASAAAAAVQGAGLETSAAPAAPAAPAEPTPLEIMEGVEVPVEAAVIDEAVAPVLPEEMATMDDVAMALQQAGIDLGIRKNDLPPELHQAYDNLTHLALTAADAYQTTMLEMQDSQMQMRQFAQAIQEDPQKVLLTMAVTNPEAFTTAITQFEEMQNDERVKSMVLRELKAEATLKAAQRAQSVHENAQRQNTVMVLTNATKSAASRHGVDPNVAEQMVAMSIQANGGQLDVRQIDGIVARLRPVATSTRPVATAAKMAAVAGAPTRDLQGVGTPAAPIEPAMELSPGLTHGSRNPMFALVKDASRRVNAAIRGE